jgi:DNA-binding response OmpR family regulator
MISESSQNKHRILLIEDEKRIADIVVAYLQRHGYEPIWANDGVKGWDAFITEHPNLVILDLMLPYIQGDVLCRKIRAQSSIPIIMLTAKAAESDILTGLDMGADDYMTKPFSPRELMARINALLRRSEGMDAKLQRRISLGVSLVVDLDLKEAFKNGVPLKLTRNEYNILSVMAASKGRIFSREELISEAFGDEYDGFDRTIDSHIKNLRKKISVDRDYGEYIVTVYGMGYRISGDIK